MPTVLITGTNRGLGLEMTRQYTDRGWSVIALNRSASPALDALREDRDIELHLADLTDDEALAAVAAELEGRPIDVLVNNAGTMGRKGFADGGLKASGFGGFDREDWHDVWDINVCTPQRVAELFVDNVAAADNGRIVTISSMLGSMKLNTVGGLYVYRATKAGVNAIMRSMGIDLAERGVIAVAMHPGWVKTDMGGPNADIEPQESIRGMISVIDELTPGDAGKCLAWNGDVLPW